MFFLDWELTTDDRGRPVKDPVRLLDTLVREELLPVARVRLEEVEQKALREGGGKVDRHINGVFGADWARLKWNPLKDIAGGWFNYTGQIAADAVEELMASAEMSAVKEQIEVDDGGKDIPLSSVRNHDFRYAAFITWWGDYEAYAATHEANRNWVKIAHTWRRLGRAGMVVNRLKREWRGTHRIKLTSAYSQEFGYPVPAISVSLKFVN
jgi:hypothetical protein